MAVTAAFAIVISLMTAVHAQPPLSMDNRDGEMGAVGTEVVEDERGGADDNPDLASAWDAAHRASVAEAEKYAYMDIESASDELREKILASRNAIIFNSDWVTDGVVGYRVSASGIRVEMPHLSELFPSDWDIP
ncbi:MAG: hypothetical protein LBJ84_05245 [Oscillospiraceae bacterium]|nr:hypothetical protein [Oscillospiraceae bacterium]